MSSTTLYRLSGVILFIGSVCAILSLLLEFALPHSAGDAFDSVLYSSPLYFPTMMLGFLGSMFVVASLHGLYIRQAPKAGILGLLGLALIVPTLTVNGVVAHAVSAVVSPQLAVHPATQALLNGGPWPSLPLVTMLLIVGYFLFGLATFLARVFSRGIGVLLILGAIAYAAWLVIPDSPFGALGVLLANIGFAWGGIALLFKKGIIVQPVQSVQSVSEPRSSMA